MNNGAQPNNGGMEPVELPIDGVLDLHTFRPAEVKGLVNDYLAECRARGILEVRIIHGKGIGQMRQTVHSILARHPDVISFVLAGEAYGGSGATIVHLTCAKP
jgi:DNA-nicking Smr family endonuclease